MKLIRGFTMVEALSVVVIVATLSALLLPVFKSALKSAHESSSVSRMKQLQLALTMYRQDYDGLEFGTASQMGLPTIEALLMSEGRIVEASRDLWKSACGQHPDAPFGFTNFNYYPDNDNIWDQYSRRRGSTSVLLSDFNCLPTTLPVSAQFRLKKIPFVRLDGSASNRSRMGSPTEYWVWFHDD